MSKKHLGSFNRLFKKINQEMPTPPPRTREVKHFLNIIPQPKEIDKLEVQDISKCRAVTKKKLNNW